MAKKVYPLPDYADWLTPERVEAEEVQWAEVAEYKRYGQALADVIALARETTSPVRVVELGCGTGWVPWWLHDGLDVGQHVVYEGVDRTEECLRRAEARCTRYPFGQVLFRNAELRTFTPNAHVVCAFAVLKHFRLTEWQRLFVQWFGQAPYAVFTVPIARRPRDDGTEFTHTWQNEESVQAALSAAGLRELWRDTTRPEEPLIVAGRV